MLSDNSTKSMGKVRLVSTSTVVRQLHKHDVTKWDCLVPQWLSDHKHDGTKWDYLVPQGWSDIITNTIGQSETVWTSRVVRQLRDKVRLFGTSRVVRHLRKHYATKWDCLVPQMLSDNSTNSVGKVRLVSTSSDNFTNTMWQSETV